MTSEAVSEQVPDGATPVSTTSRRSGIPSTNSSVTPIASKATRVGLPYDPTRDSTTSPRSDMPSTNSSATPNTLLHSPQSQSPAATIGCSRTTSASSPLEPATHPVARRQRAWTSEEDQKLKEAHEEGMYWHTIQKTHFPYRSSGACKERLRSVFGV